MLEMFFAFVLGCSAMIMGCFAVMGQDDNIQSMGIISIAGLIAIGVLSGFYSGGITDPKAVLMHLLGEAFSTYALL